MGLGRAPKWESWSGGRCRAALSPGAASGRSGQDFGQFRESPKYCVGKLHAACEPQFVPPWIYLLPVITYEFIHFFCQWEAALEWEPVFITCAVTIYCTGNHTSMYLKLAMNRV